MDVSRGRTRKNTEGAGRERLLLTGFVLSGFATPMLAALGPWLAQKHQLNSGQLGVYFAVQFGCSFLTSIVSNRRPAISMRVGFTVLALGLLALVSANHALSLGGAGMIGLGLGLVIPASNGICAYSANATSRLITLNLLWSAGALASSILLRKMGAASFLLLGFVAALCLVHGLAWLWHSAEPVINIVARPNSLALETAFALTLFFYVGAENGIVGWAKLLCSPDPNSGLASAALIGFWTALLLGRLVAPKIARWIPERVFLYASLALAVVCTLLVQIWPSPVLDVVAITVSGFALAPMFPLLVVVFSKRIPQHRAWAFCASGLGAATLPWLMGVMGERFPLRIAYALPCLAFAIIFVLLRLSATESTARL